MPIQLRIALAPLFGGGPRRRSGFAQHRLGRRGDAGAGEKARVLAAEQPHDIGKSEVAEIGCGRQPVLDHLISTTSVMSGTSKWPMSELKIALSLAPNGLVRALKAQTFDGSSASQPK